MVPSGGTPAGIVERSIPGRRDILRRLAREEAYKEREILGRIA
jgi:hypothetical protein